MATISPSGVFGPKQYRVLAMFHCCVRISILTLGRNARIAGMETDLNLDSHSYAWLLTIFYISYTLFEFQALMWKVMRPHQWAAVTVFGWYQPLTLPTYPGSNC